MGGEAEGGDPLLAWRKEFPILERKVYLISNSLGAMPRRVYERLRAYADIWAEEGVVAWETWLPLVTETGDLAGRIFGAAPGETMMHQNVSTALSVIASCFDWKPPRDKIVYDAGNFPTVHYVMKAQERRGARVLVVPTEPDGTVSTERLCAAIDERTRLVPISLVNFRTSFLQDAAAVIARAHQVGALVCLDAYQAVGTVPVDVKALDADFLVGGSVKWLCGGPGAAFLYARRDLWPSLEPMQTGWFSHPEPFAFDMGEPRYAETVHRFMGGSPSVPALYAARSGYEAIAEVGVARIREKSRRQTALLVDRALARGFTVNTPRDPDRRGGTVSIDFEGAGAVARELVARGFLVDYRPGGGIRVSPHFYNADEECLRALAEIDAIRQVGPDGWLHLAQGRKGLHF